MKKKVVLAGNPNSGKTTLFNQLTGSSAHVGNWPGVTVDKREGLYEQGNQTWQVIDLPGIYSLAPYSPEEIIARNFLINDEPDVIVNVVDATNLERNLYLTTQLMELDYPIVLAINMIDLLDKEGRTIDIEQLSAALNLPIIPISAQKKLGLEQLMESVATIAPQRQGMSALVEAKKIAPTIARVSYLLEKQGVPHALYHTSKLLDEDRGTLDWEQLPKKQEIFNLNEDLMIRIPQLDAEIAHARYDYIERHYANTLSQKNKQDLKLTTTEKIDRIATSRVLGIPLFLFIMFGIFHLTFSENLFGFTHLPSPGVFGKELIEQGQEILAGWLGQVLTQLHASDWAIAFVNEGIIAGVGAVFSFLPLIFILYICLSILEYSGYMARAAFLLDRIFRRFGLSGKSFMPLLMGFGCSVPAIMSARTLNSERDRKLTIMLIPFMSCGAKAPIWALMAATFFPKHAGLAVFAIYLLGVVVAIVSGILLKLTVFRGEIEPFIMELPTYHLPSYKSVLKTAWQKVKGFAIRAGTVLAAATIIIWFLSNLSGHFELVGANTNESIIGSVGNRLTFIFEPLGFASGAEGWKAVVAIITGLIAKEIVISTMGVLYAPDVAGDPIENKTASTALSVALVGVFSPLGAFSFMAFNLLYAPCVAAISAYHKELGHSLKWTGFTMVFHFCVAWLVSFVIYQGGTLLGF